MVKCGKYIPYFAVDMLGVSVLPCFVNAGMRVCAQTKCQNQTGPRYAKHEARISAKVVKPGDGGNARARSECSMDEEKYDALYMLVPRLCRSFDDQSFVRAE